MSASKSLTEPPQSDSQDGLKSFQARIVILSFLSYFFYYYTRKNLGIATSSMIEEGFTEETIGWIQSGYGILYALGQFICGGLGDKLGARIMIFCGMALSAIASIAIGFFPLTLVLLIAWPLNGLFQSTGWSNNCKLIATWIPHDSRGRVMGIWSLCYVLGSISANVVCGYLVEHYNWKLSFLVTGFTVLSVAIIQGLFLINRPEQKGFTIQRRNGASAENASQKGNFKRMLTNPIILLYGGSYFSLKFIRYTFFIWLPFYFEKRLNYDTDVSAYSSNAFEVGGVIGLLCGGILADKVFSENRGRLAWLGLIALCAALFVFRNYAHSSYLAVLFSLGAVGLFLYIADAQVSGTAAQDVAGADAAASATGIVNGLGSVGGALAGIVPIWIKQSYGWDGVFLLFIALTALAILLTFPVALRRQVGKA
ncbi:MFS transporter [Rubritalea tangerina]|uniref:MFS transporter n=1 Tax=Rubritalea tangerina TaxID=430798 RepID=A0ABW4ZD41_9BACT